jgi:hypothetical protein
VTKTVVKSSLPFSMAVKLPLEVSEGDKRIALPLIQRARSAGAGQAVGAVWQAAEAG